MEIGLTTLVQNKISSLSLEQLQESDCRFWWEVNLTKIGNRNALVIVQPSSRYCMVYSNLKPSIHFNDEPSTNALHPEYTCIFPQDYFVNEMKNLLFGEEMRLRFATKKGNITIRDGKIVESNK